MRLGFWDKTETPWADLAHKGRETVGVLGAGQLGLLQVSLLSLGLVLDNAG